MGFTKKLAGAANPAKAIKQTGEAAGGFGKGLGKAAWQAKKIASGAVGSVVKAPRKIGFGKKRGW